MNSRPSIQYFAALLAAIPLICPGWMQPVSAVEPVPAVSATSNGPAEPRLLDIVLLAGNVLAGEVVDAEGTFQADTEVVVSRGRHEIARGTTNKSGKFFIEVPRGGVYLVTAGRCVKVVRSWTATAAPPAARDHVTLSPPTVIRGQNPCCGGNALLGLLLVGGIAAAIAIPIALNNSGHDNASKGQSSPALGDDANLIAASP